MGQFLSISGVIGCGEELVAGALRAYAEGNGGSLEKAQLTVEDYGCLVISEGIGGTTVLFPGDFFEWDSASQYLSQRLKQPVFSFHIHDGDLWMFALYEKDEVVDQFNPMPDYWHELDSAERLSWQGNASEVAKRVPGLSPDQVSKYLVQWGDDWQLVDFMNKLGLEFPLDDRGAPHGLTCRFEFKPREAR